MLELRMRRGWLPLRPSLKKRRRPPRLGISTLQAIGAVGAALQPAVISLAVIVGGVWTAYTFSAQLYVENARAQLQKLIREVEAEPRLEIEINTTQLGVPGSSDRFVLGTINIKNVGSANTLLLFPEPPVRIYRVTVGAREVWALVRSLNLKVGPNARTGSLVCQANASTHADFIAPVDTNGLYVVTFSSPRSRAEAHVAKSLGAEISGPEGRIEWKAVHYFAIR